MEDENNSIKISEMLHIRHSVLLRTIRRYIFQLKNENSDMYFILANYINKQNKIQPCYDITLKGIKYILDNMRRDNVYLKDLMEYYNTYSNKKYVPIVLHERLENLFIKQLQEVLKPLNYTLETQKSLCNNKYRLDGYIPELNLAIEYDEKQHEYQQKEDKVREKEIDKELNCDFVRVDYKNTDAYNIGIVMKKIIELSNKKSA